MTTLSEHQFLIVDDSEIDAIITGKILQRAGLPKPHVTALSATEALKFLRQLGEEGTLAQRAYPLIVLLDIHMPEINGFEFLSLYDQLGRGVSDYCRIFLLTSSIDPTDIERANRDEHVVRVLNKPLVSEEFLYYFEKI